MAEEREREREREKRTTATREKKKKIESGTLVDALTMLMEKLLAPPWQAN